MSSSDSRNFEERQISQPVSLAANVSSGKYLSHGNNLSRNGTKVSDVLPSSDVVSARASSKQLPFSNNQNPIDVGVIEFEGTCRSFSLDEVLIATNNFDDALVIGNGGFGKVYKGFIDDSATMVAIKRLNAKSKQGAREFWMEVKMLSKLRHANLVALIGYCNECQEMILVYEYMALGTLADHLYRLKTTESNMSFSPLSWEERLDMCIGAARGLDHLHSGTSQSFIHRDVKSTNILIDKNWVAKISDFGLSKGLTSHSITHISTEVKGTFGYLDPDYFHTFRLTVKSDVYAFGVVLLEVLCGRPPVDSKLDSEQIGLIYWAQQCFKKGKFAEVIDPSLSGQIAQPCLKSFVELVKNCLSESPRSRPPMAEVLGRLELALLSQQRGRTKGKMTKAFQNMMDRWLRERKDNSSSSGQSNDLLSSRMNKANEINMQIDPVEEQNMQIEPPNVEFFCLIYMINHDNEMLPVSVVETHKDAHASVEDQNMEIVPPIGYQKGSKALAPVKPEVQKEVPPIEVPALSLAELKEKTDNFGLKSLIDGGSNGRVYYASLSDGKAVAIKMLDAAAEPESNVEFLTQVSMVSKLKHENLVELLGYCVEGNVRVLEYEFATMGSLHDVLHGRTGVQGAQPRPVLDWIQRVRIAVDAARGLEYLHEKFQPSITHRLIRSSKVLLFEDFKAKIADFNLSHQAPKLPFYVEVRIPYFSGYAFTEQLTKETDVYSFGVVLLELLTGRKPDDRTMPPGQLCLVTWLAAVAALCLQYDPEFRPNMSIVVKALQPLLRSSAPPPPPPDV
ncbi:hypothetical protein RHSIM_Rhsim02G0075500 [Rhododendron simsii]|uniref:Protein kinase domain-containing protein n=1 Tax=Rhododendron simsii TaxID=118357 RepID=A0A834H9C8_RHOSS|nr:hypothetical protein RHSIM_Rhsim02G0075500 [Rhododendron simsii]